MSTGHENILQCFYRDDYHPYKRYEGHNVAIYIYKTLTQTEVTLNKPLEAVACSVRFNNTYLAICSLYLPPNTPVVDDDITSLISQLPGNRLVVGHLTPIINNGEVRGQVYAASR